MFWKGLIIGSLFVLVGAGCSEEPVKENWTGFFYTDKDNLNDESTWRIQPGFESHSDCMIWVAEMSKERYNFDYECGRDCKFDKELKLNICKETI